MTDRQAQAKNRFERRADLYNERADERATRMQAAWDEPPADSVEPSTDELRQMWHLSPYGADAPQRFWEEHDGLMQQAMAAGDPDPHARAEQGAMKAVYPWRMKQVGAGQAHIDVQIANAERLARLAEQQQDAAPQDDAAILEGSTVS